MQNLSKIIKPWKEADALSARINLYKFWSETAFLNYSRKANRSSSNGAPQ